jgi:hypothetical protein
MEKEILTINKIKKDLIQYLHQETLGVIIGFPSLWLIIAMSNIAIKNLFSIGNKIFEAITLILIFSLIISITYIGIMYVKINKREFTLKNDTLIEKRNFKQGGTKWHSYRPYRLSFTCNHFDIPAQLSYKWSNIYSMNEKEVYNTSSIGDNFTLVEFNKKVIAVYNHKFFTISPSHI